MRRANEDFSAEQTMRVAGFEWSAATTERSRAYSLHVSEMGRHTLEGSVRVAASEASLTFDKGESS